jgi:dipeptidyl aminopeptidase/acylaminoacyl peptidase
MRVIRFLIVVFGVLSCTYSPIALAQQAKRPFTVADEIGMTLFGTPNGVQSEVHFSPDGNYFAILSERGRLDLNCPEDSLRFYASQDVKNFLEHPLESQLPLPVWVIARSPEKQGASINNWRWLADSSGVIFLERTAANIRRLVLANLRKQTMEQLTSEMELVNKFDVQDRQHYAYTVTDPIPRESLLGTSQASSFVGTGHSVLELLFPDDPKTVDMALTSRNHLWAVIGDKRFEVKHDSAPVLCDRDFALSPDGLSLITTQPVPEIPSSWESLYPPPYASDPFRIRASHQNSVSQYVRINLETGSAQALTNAPTSRETDAGMWAAVEGGPTWSKDGREILLPDTFVNSAVHAPSRPCVAVVELLAGKSTCVEMLKGRTETSVEEGYHEIKDARFVGGDGHHVKVSFYDNRDFSIGQTEYRRAGDDSWQVVGQDKGQPEAGYEGLEITVKQGLDDPPQLVARSKRGSRVIWDPNPQLKEIELGSASVYTWRNKEGREWSGGLYKPTKYKRGQRYPLVIQTHGFRESLFEPSGLFPTAFAARALAAAGIVVLQVGERCPTATPYEGPCAVSGYEAAANQLISEGLVDSEKIGIIGFSRTCFYVMETLTNSSIHLRAASITDGVMEDYLQYMIAIDFARNTIGNDYDSLIGAPPFGEGLQQWLKRSPGFKLDKINAPLLVVGEGAISVLSMWQPYAGLRYLHKPVDLILLNTDEHVLTNPAVRMASQGGSVDWFRFWLQDYEDPDPAKAEQYQRWRQLRKLQDANERNSTTSLPGAN